MGWKDQHALKLANLILYFDRSWPFSWGRQPAHRLGCICWCTGRRCEPEINFVWQVKRYKIQDFPRPFHRQWLQQIRCWSRAPRLHPPPVYIMVKHCLFELPKNYLCHHRDNQFFLFFSVFRIFSIPGSWERTWNCHIINILFISIIVAISP